MPLTEENIAAKKARLVSATQGPWESVTVLPAKVTGQVRHSESEWRVINGPPQVFDGSMLCRRAFERKEDAEFIAHARSDIPELLAEREELLREIASLKTEVDALDDLAQRAEIELNVQLENQMGHEHNQVEDGEETT